MDGIISVAHFCETHGPCVILSTQKYDEIPEQKPHSLNVHCCKSCESLSTAHAFVSKEEQNSYVTTRSPLQQEAAFLLRQAAVRSLSCEHENVAYFGDNERGHVFSRCFSLHDTFARGFLRKYAIIVLMRDKLRLLNAWPLLSKHIDDIVAELVESSAKLNRSEQIDKSQKSLRQSEGSPSNIARSLPELTANPAIYVYCHQRFTWLLKCQVAIANNDNLSKAIVLPPPNDARSLRLTQQLLGEDVFSRALMAFLHGGELQCSDEEISESFKSIWPKFAFNIGTNAKDDDLHRKACRIVKENGEDWMVITQMDLSCAKCKLQKDLEVLIADRSISDKVLHYQTVALATHWINAAKLLIVCPEVNLDLTRSLNIAKQDLVFVNFLISKLCPHNYLQLGSRLNILHSK